MKDQRFNMYFSNFKGLFSLIILKLPCLILVGIVAIIAYVVGASTYVLITMKQWGWEQTLFTVSTLLITWGWRLVVTRSEIEASVRWYQIPARLGRWLNLEAIQRKVFFAGVQAALVQQHHDDTARDADGLEKEAAELPKVHHWYGKLFSLSAAYLGLVFRAAAVDNQPFYLFGLIIAITAGIFLYPAVYDYRSSIRRRNLLIAKWLREWLREQENVQSPLCYPCAFWGVK